MATSPLPDSELQAIAERAEAAREAMQIYGGDPTKDPISRDNYMHKAALYDFRITASPDTVLRLIAEIKRLKGDANG